MPPKKRKPLGLGRSSAHAKRLKAQRQTEKGRAEHAAESLAAYHARSQSEEHSEQEGASTSRDSQARRTQERETERNTAARSTRRQDKEFSDHERNQGRVARAAIRQISGNRREEQSRRQALRNMAEEQARNTAARRVQRQATPNRAQEQERARTKRKENEERKLLAFYAKLQEAEARLGQDEEPSVQSMIHDEKLRRLAENDFDFNIFLDNPVMEAGKKMHKELKELEWGACSNCQEYCFNTE
jgi:hypothetical protein